MKTHALRIAGWAATLVVLGGVFMLYQQPEFMVGLANQVWACF